VSEGADQPFWAEIRENQAASGRLVSSVVMAEAYSLADFAAPVRRAGSRPTSVRRLTDVPRGGDYRW